MDERKDCWSPSLGLAVNEAPTVQRLVSASNDFQVLISRLETAVSIDPISEGVPTLLPSELDDLVQQHASSIKQADAYQLGDLESLRTECKDAASSKTMTQRDTDIVELALSALTVLDKGRHLIRQRSKMLDLVALRMKWEEQKATVTKELAALSLDVNKFVSKARWMLPEDATARRRRISMQAKTVKSPLRNMITNGRLGAPAEASPLGGGSTSSTMARRMRLDILNLDLARNTQRIHSLSQASIVYLGRTLDKFIDTSTVRLPDAFLDQQEELENRISALTVNLTAFLLAMVKQWHTADEVYWLSEEIDQEAVVIQREIQAELVKKPTLQNAKVYREQLAKVSDKSTIGRLKVERELPMPTHSQFSEQQEANAQLKAFLLKCLDNALKSGTSLEDSVKAYTTAATAVDRIENTKAALIASNATFGEIQRSTLSFQHALPDLVIDARIPLDPTLGRRISDLRAGLMAEVDTAKGLIEQAAVCLTDVEKLRLDPNLQQSLRELLKSAREAKRSTTSSVEDAGNAYKQRFVLSQYIMQAFILHQHMNSIHSALRDDFKRFRRKPGDSPTSDEPLQPSLEHLESGLAILSSHLSTLTAVASTKSNLGRQLMTHHRRAISISTQIARLKAAVLACAQQSASFSNHLDALRQLQASVTETRKAPGATKYASHQERFLLIQQQQATLPFLGIAFDEELGLSMPELEHDLLFRNVELSEILKTNDDHFREETNALTLDVSSQLVQLQHTIDTLEAARLGKEAGCLIDELTSRTTVHRAAFQLLQPELEQSVNASIQPETLEELARQLDDIRTAKQSFDPEFILSMDRISSVTTKLAILGKVTPSRLLTEVEERSFELQQQWTDLQGRMNDTMITLSSRNAFLAAKLAAEARDFQAQETAEIEAACMAWKRAEQVFQEYMQQASKHHSAWQVEIEQFPREFANLEVSPD